VENETFGQKMIRIAHMIESDPLLKADFERRVQQANDVQLPPLIFNCPVETSPEIPTSVHRLRPSDIKVIGAFGDSISAGNGLGAETAPAVAIENRGEVFTVGGDETFDTGVITLTNFFRKFNPDIKGYSHCPSTVDNLDRSWLNVAEPGGTCRNMPPQAREIIERMRNDERIDFENDWKLVSLFVGGNDLCASCRRVDYTPENYGLRFREAVQILYDQVPRIIVNLIVMFDITPLPLFSTGIICRQLQDQFCDCVFNATTRPQLRPTQLAYHDQLMAIGEDPAFQGRDDFAVVVQPHMRDMEPPRDHITGEYLGGFLAPDCFHPSRVSHQAFAFFLWNTMLTPVGMKPLTSETTADPSVPVHVLCPTPKNPYIFTHENSVGVDWP